MSTDDTEINDEKPEIDENDFVLDEFASVRVCDLEAVLYLVATPIGNLRDISLRALDVLRGAAVIYCEDTRVTRKLLGAYQIRGHLKSYNDHSDDERRDEIVAAVQSGQAVALVSDAGMPMVSDPGYKLVKACEAAGVNVTTVPGANAPLAALQLSGLPSGQFSFMGFLPNKTKARSDYLRKWMSVPSTLIAFETAPRLIPALKDIGATLGMREVAVVREITKLYEEVRKGKAVDLIEYYVENGLPKGEIVLVIAPPVEDVVSDDDIIEMIRDALKSMRTKDAAAFVAEKTNRKKNEIYDMALKLDK